jgi:hypothetical protein
MLHLRHLLAFGAAAVLLSGAASAQPQGGRPPPDRRFVQPDPIAFDDHTGYTRIFDGATLQGWAGDPKYWRVEKGAIVGESSKDKPLSNTYLVYQGAKAKDFDLKLEIKIEEGGGSGVQYRSFTGRPWVNGKPLPNEAPYNPDWMMTGPQADFWYPTNPLTSSFTGQVYSENNPLGILAWRGQVVQVGPDGRKRLLADIGDRAALGGYVKINGWNQYLIIARGGVMMQILNGRLMAISVDDDPGSIDNQPGRIGIELESFPTRLSVREVWLKTLD